MISALLLECLQLNMPSIAFMFCIIAEPYPVDWEILYYQAKRESEFRPNAVGNYKTASHGLMQFTKSTAKNVCGMRGKELYDPYKSLRCGIFYMWLLLDGYGWDYYTSLAAYNQGPPSVNRNGIYGSSGRYATKILEDAGYVLTDE